MLKDKVALITGASRGLGAAIAKRYAKEHAHVILVARSKRELEQVDDVIKAEGGKSTLVVLDISKPNNIDQLAYQVFERFGKIDILVGNAGILETLTPMHQQPQKVWNKVLDLNLTANWHLIRALDPLLRRSDAPRTIFVTSSITKEPTPYWGVYSISKVALEHMVKIYAAENEPTTIRANLVDPGFMATEMHKKAFPGRNMDDYPNPDTLTDVFVKLALESFTDTGKLFYAQK